MAHVAADLVKETTTTTGTGALTLGGAVSGFRAFSAVMAASDTCIYGIVGGTEWEFGIGTYNTTLTRTTVISSSNAGAAVTLSAGTKDVFITTIAAMMGWSEITATPSTDQNDYAPTGFANAGQVNLNIGGTMKLTGLAGGYVGRRIALVNTSTDYLLWLENENTSSSAGNRFRLPKGFPAFLLPGDFIELRYDGTLQRWRVISWPTMGEAMGLTTFEDAAGNAASSTGQSWGSLAGTFSGTAASITTTSPYLVNTTEKPFGTIAVNTGTTTTGRAFLGFSGLMALWGQGPMLSVSRVAIEIATDGTQTFNVITGFLDQSAGGTPVSGCAWEYRWNGSAAEWSQTSYAASAATRSTSGSPSADTNYNWRVCFVNPAGTRVDMLYSADSVSFTKASSVSSGLPAAGVTVGFSGISILKSAGTTTRRASVDLVGVRADYVRG